MNRLVEIEKHIDDVRLDLRYATTNNITGTELYPVPRAFLIDEALDALTEVQAELVTENLGIVIWDAYRPLSVSKRLWDHTPEDKRLFVADPKDGSVHNRGCAVDLTLQNLTTQTTVEQCPVGLTSLMKQPLLTLLVRVNKRLKIDPLLYELWRHMHLMLTLVNGGIITGEIGKPGPC